ncbi:MAG: hypothetical protein GC201_14020 [Alphaproteobacteria bacterium]|nr:hypothetical protein [Alphaproteobacteria bacterium]
MGRVICEKDVAAPADAVWAVLADFAGFLDWTGGTDGGRSIEIEGSGEGMVRHLVLPGIGQMAERLVRLDDRTRTQVYELVSGQPIGMATYRATVVVSEAPGGTRLHWTGEFEPAQGADADAIVEGLRGSYNGMSDALAAAANK